MAIVKQNGTGRGLIFIDAKGKPQIYEKTNEDGTKKKEHGALVISHPNKTKEVLPSNTSISGVVTMVDVRQSEYDGETINSLQVRIEDSGEPPIQLSVALGSFFAAKIVGLLNAADLSRPISFALNTVLKGDKFGEGVSERDNVFPTMRAGPNNDRLVPVWANGATTLPEAPEVKFNGKMMRNMDPVNELVGETLNSIYASLDTIKENQMSAMKDNGPHDDDHGISAADVATAAGSVERARG